ncbi:MAG: YjiH family protein [Acidobacteria bacterium]|nr:YjiH family protein [Acidobacteriota bacterium]
MPSGKSAATDTADSSRESSRPLLKFIGWSFLGSFIFFVPISINQTTTIPLDHILTVIQNTVPWFGPLFALAVIAIGGILPFRDKSWNRDGVTAVLSILKLLGIGAGIMAYGRIGPDWLLKEDLLPFLWTKVAVPVAIIVPLGSIFLTFIICYGLLEFIGVLMRPIMRPIWKLPGRSAVDAVTSFVGSFAIAMFLTNRIYKEGKYTEREAAIILTGFSSVSASFMVIVARTLGLMEIWNTFFWTTLLVTYLVSAITPRLYPLKSIRNEYYLASGTPEPSLKGNLLCNALRAGLEAAGKSGSLYHNIRANLKDGMFMTFRLISTIISVGLISLVLVETTPVFDYIGYIFYPFAYLTRLPDPAIVAKAAAVAGAEMFIPSVLVAGTPGVAVMSKFVVGVVSIALILFFSGSIPCLLSTDVRLSVRDLMIIMVERAVLALLIAAPIAHFLF